MAQEVEGVDAPNEDYFWVLSLLDDQTMYYTYCLVARLPLPQTRDLYNHDEKDFHLTIAKTHLTSVNLNQNQPQIPQQ